MQLFILSIFEKIEEPKQRIPIYDIMLVFSVLSYVNIM